MNMTLVHVEVRWCTYLILESETIAVAGILDCVWPELLRAWGVWPWQGNGIKSLFPSKVPSGSHQCYSHLCLWAIFYITIYFLRLFFIFLIFSRGTPFTLFHYFPCYPLHFIRFLLYFYFTFYFSFFDSFTWYPLHFIRRRASCAERLHQSDCVDQTLSWGAGIRWSRLQFIKTTCQQLLVRTVNRIATKRGILP